MSRLGFFSKEEICANLRRSGTKPTEKELLSTFVKNGDINLEIFFKRQVDIGSKEHCLLGSFSIANMTSFSSNLANLFKLTPGLQRELGNTVV